MKYAICNEIFAGWTFEKAFAAIRGAGYDGVEIAPFTFREDDELFDIRLVPVDERREVRRMAEDAGLEILGLHWLFAKTEGLYLTSPDKETRRQTALYLAELVSLCHDLGGAVMVLGSPQQRNLLPGVTHDEAMEYAAGVLRQVMPACASLGVTIAVEPLSPAEGDFLLTAAAGRRLVQLVNSTNCRLHLDVKAMSSESTPIPEIIRASRDDMVHFHVNDPNLLGPGMGDVDFVPIFAALREIGYDGWASVESFDRSVDPVEIAKKSISYMRQTN